MNIQRRNNRFVSECLHCAIAEQDVGPVLPRTMNQPLPAPSDTPSRTGQVTVADAMVQRFAQFGVIVMQASFFGRPVGEVIATLAPDTPPNAPVAVNPTKAQRTFVMPALSALPQAA